MDLSVTLYLLMQTSHVAGVVLVAGCTFDRGHSILVLAFSPAKEVANLGGGKLLGVLANIGEYRAVLLKQHEF